VQGVRVTLVDGSYHNVDSSEMAFKIAVDGLQVGVREGEPTLLEPIMELEVTVPTSRSERSTATSTHGGDASTAWSRRAA
jgi:translation elongation factor EF-G